MFVEGSRYLFRKSIPDQTRRFGGGILPLIFPFWECAGRRRWSIKLNSLISFLVLFQIGRVHVNEFVSPRNCPGYECRPAFLDKSEFVFRLRGADPLRCPFHVRTQDNLDRKS